MTNKLVSVGITWICPYFDGKSSYWLDMDMG